jgi:hypothetical protein
MKIVVEESVLASPEVKGILSIRGGIFAKAFARPNLVFELKPLNGARSLAGIALDTKPSAPVGYAKLRMGLFSADQPPRI